jgi:hypothetical protein
MMIIIIEQIQDLILMLNMKLKKKKISIRHTCLCCMGTSFHNLNASNDPLSASFNSSGVV